MTLPYGKTDFWTTLKQYLTDRTESKTREPLWSGVPTPVVSYLRAVITEVIKERVPAAKDAMEWLRDIAKLLAAANEPVKWTTPSGMKITQHYRDIRGQVKIRTRHNAKFQPITKLSSNQARPSDPMKVRKQARALAPNFVHSLDASHLAETVRLAKSQGITSFAMVHDSYATTAAETEALTAALTTTFRSMYQRHNVLAELRDRVVAVLGDLAEVRPVPERGDLKLGAMPFLFN
jgi:DNA-directed RNA polymerase